MTCKLLQNLRQSVIRLRHRSDLDLLIMTVSLFRTPILKKEIVSGSLEIIYNMRGSLFENWTTIIVGEHVGLYDFNGIACNVVIGEVKLTHPVALPFRILCQRHNRYYLFKDRNSKMNISTIEDHLIRFRLFWLCLTMFWLCVLWSTRQSSKWIVKIQSQKHITASGRQACLLYHLNFEFSNQNSL